MSAPARHARLFRNGRNQAVRIPREFELAADVKPLNEDFPAIDDPPTTPEDTL